MTGEWFREARVTMPSHGQPCQRCSALAGDAYLCPACIDQLETQLANIPALWDELQVTLTRQDNVRRPQVSAGRPRTTTALAVPVDTSEGRQVVRGELSRGGPWSEQASRAGDELRSALVGAIRAVTEHRGREVPQLATVAEMATWLVTVSASVAFDPAGADICAEVEAAYRRAMRTIDTCPERVWVGHCPTCEERLTAEREWTTVRCRTCTEVSPVADLIKARDERIRHNAGNRKAMVEMAATCGLKLTRDGIDGWVRRGRLTPVMQTEAGKVFLFGDVLDLIRERDDSAA